MARSWAVIRTHDGELLTQIDMAIRWELVRSFNSVGAWFMDLTAEFDHQLLGVDRLVEFYREPVGGREVLLGVGFMRYWTYYEDDAGAQFIRCGGGDQLDLLTRRIVAFRKNSSGALKENLPADDMMKEIVTENYTSTAGRFGDIYYSRSSAISPTHLEVAPDEGQGRTMTKEVGWRRVMDVLQEIGEASQWPSDPPSGVPIYFDLDYVAPAKFVFRTYADIRGIDRTVTTGIAPVLFSKDSGNLGAPSMTWDYRDELNLVYGGGTGEGSSRIIDPENDQVRHNLTVWNYQEGLKDAREEVTSQGVAFRAYTEMQAKRPFVEFNGALLDTPASRFGVDWFYGDRVTVRYQGFSFDGDVNGFKISTEDDGSELIEASVKIREAIEGNPD